MTQTGFNTTTLYGTAAQTGISGMYGSNGQPGTVTPTPFTYVLADGEPPVSTPGGNYSRSHPGVGMPIGNYSGGYGASGGFGASGGQPGYGGIRHPINPMGGFGARGGEGGSSIPQGIILKYKSSGDDISLFWEGVTGLEQGGANIVNGLQDSIIGLVNMPAAFVNGIAWLEEQVGILDKTRPIRAPYIPSPDWSKGLVFEEDDLSHNVSKFSGSAGVELLGGLWISKLGLANRTANSGLKSFVPNSGNLVFHPASNSWTSTAGLVYGQGSKHGNRVKHVLDHLVPNASKTTNSVFSVDRTKLIGLIDEAFAKRGAGVLQANGNLKFEIDMGRIIGVKGETRIRLILEDGTNNVITAFPIP